MSTPRRGYKKIPKGEDEALKIVDEFFNELRQVVDKLERIVRGQRMINGYLYAAHLETLEVVSRIAHTPELRKGVRSDNALKEAYEHLDNVGGKEPPGCEIPGGN
jgi:hypothetical protein